MSSTFPTEVFELIIDSIEDDRYALQNCALICRTWLPRSRFNLFRTIDLAEPDDLDRFAELITASSHLGDLVREVCISDSSLGALFRPLTATLARFPAVLGPRLKNVRKLTICHQVWDVSRWHSEYLTHLSRFTSITELVLFEVTFRTIADYSLILHALPNLSVLRNDCLDFERYLDGPIKSTFEHHPRLVALELGTWIPAYVADWLFDSMSFSCLEETVCRYQLPDDFTSIRLGNLWRAAGPSLHNVTVSIFSRTPMTVLSQQVVEERFSLAHNTSLRTIRFDGSSPSGMPLECGWMYFMLAHIVSPHVESVTFAFRTIQHASFLMRDYTHLIDSTLTRPPFANLQTVLFLLDTPFSDDEVRLLRDQFPDLFCRRLLRIRRAHRTSNSWS